MYKIVVTKAVPKQISNLPLEIADKMGLAINNLSHNPRPHGIKKLKNKTINNLFFLVALLAIVSCKESSRKPEVEHEKVVTREILDVPDFNADTAYKFIEQQVAFGPRVPGSRVSIECANYLYRVLRQYGAEVVMQEATARAFNGKLLPVKNIIGSWQPENPKRILLCAHWDSRPYADWDTDESNRNKPIDGANDGGSGVGVLLEIARHLSQEQPHLGIDIILFDAEDYGEPQGVQSSIKEHNWALGSQYWSKNPHKSNYSARFGILLDMVGAEDATFYMEGHSMYFASNIVKKVWDTAHRIGHSKYFIFQEANPITDDHYYINQNLNIPAINIIHQDKSSNTGFFKYWHTIDDTVDKIDKETLKAVGQTVLAVIYNE